MCLLPRSACRSRLRVGGAGGGERQGARVQGQDTQPIEREERGREEEGGRREANYRQVSGPDSEKVSRTVGSSEVCDRVNVHRTPSSPPVSALPQCKPATIERAQKIEYGREVSVQVPPARRWLPATDAGAHTVNTTCAGVDSASEAKTSTSWP